MGERERMMRRAATTWVGWRSALSSELCVRSISPLLSSRGWRMERREQERGGRRMEGRSGPACETTEDTASAMARGQSLRMY